MGIAAVAAAAVMCNATNAAHTASRRAVPIVHVHA